MIDDPDRYRPGLARWIGDSEERLAIYNRIARGMRMASWTAGQLYETRERQPARSTVRLHSIWTYAVLVLGLAATGIGITHLVGLGNQPTLPAQSAEIFDTSDGQPRSVTLPDGSRILMKAGSHIEVSLSHTSRDILLSRGDAEFRVAHAAAWPFVVHAGGGRVTARGTVFEVTLARDVSVKLTEGVIDVAVPTQATGKPAEVRHLRAGEATHFLARTDPIALESHAMKASRDPGMKDFDGLTVGDVVAQTNQASATKIEIADPAIASRTIVLQLHQGDAEDVAEGLAEYLGLVVDRSQSGRLILRSKR
jgi:transmembrane sensor